MDILSIAKHKKTRNNPAKFEAELSIGKLTSGTYKALYAARFISNFAGTSQKVIYYLYVLSTAKTLIGS